MAADPAEITHPVRVDEDRLVHNVYEYEVTIDNASQDEFSSYIVERMYGREDEVARTYTPGDEVPEVVRVRDGWHLTPRRALALTVVATLALNAVVNGKNIVGKAGEITDDVINMIDPKTRSVEIPHPGEKERSSTTTIPVDTAGKEQASGVAERDTVSARGLVRRLKAISKSGKITKIVVTGGASDEWLDNGVKSVGRKDKENRHLSLQRAESFAESVETIADRNGIDIPDIEVKSREGVLNHDELGELLADVQESKYGSVLEAISAYNRGDKSMPRHLRSEIKRLIGSRRKGEAKVTVEQTVKIPSTVSTTETRQVEVERKDTKHPIIPLAIPIPPIPRWRREERDPFRRPPSIKEEPLDKVWVELYEEALRPSGRLVDDAWSLSRKYQFLYREERITQGLRYDYLDDDGKEQKISVLFTDREELDEGAIDAVSRLLFQISLMQRGKVAESLDTIVVLPSEHTGSQRPDKIGLGIDEQYHENILGVAIPSLGLVELQLPLKPTAEQITNFEGFGWTLAHEVAGHFTDVNKKARFIDPAKSNRPGRTFTARYPWAGAGDDGFAATARRGALRVQQFTIPYPDGRDGELIVNPGDPALAKAPSARLRGQAPTIYADQSAGELHAETAAAVTTGIPIPAEQAGLSAEALGDKASYSADAGLQHRFVTRVGARPNTEGLEWDDERVRQRLESFTPTVLRGVVELNGDARQNDTSEHAKNQPYQADEKRLKILARVRR